MDNRQMILAKLARIEGDIYELSKELEKYAWDYDTDLYVLRREDILTAIRLVLTGDISAKVVEDWANALECREDLDYETQSVHEAINELANPVLYGDLLPAHLEDIRLKISN